MNRFVIQQSRRIAAFTLVELLVSMAVFAVILALLFAVISQTSSTWRSARNQIGSFQSSRFAFDLITRSLSQATLNVHGDYDNPTTPKAYIRKSDLHFLIEGPQGNDFGQGNSVFFQAKLGKAGAAYNGMDSLLNALGYYVTYGKDPNLPPFLSALDRNRFRLMQYLEPSENLSVYATTDGSWFKKDLTANSTVIAENVIFLLFWPRLSSQDESSSDSTGDYRYDSRKDANSVDQPVTANQQPPLVTVTLVAIDESAADRLPNSADPPSEITAQLKQLFLQSSKPVTPDAYAADLAELERRLSAAHIGYRLFTSTVPIRESKWTKENL